MTFRQYIQLLAESIGLHQIPVLNHATEIRYFLAEDGVHHQLVTALVRDIYKKNCCGHLDARIDPTTTIKLLGNMRSVLLSEDGVDICRVGLMNQLCEVSALLLCKETQQSATSLSKNKMPELANI